MKSFLVLLFALWGFISPGLAEVKSAVFDLAAIRDSSTLEIKVVQDWTPAPRDPAVRQKLIEITICEWWPGQKIRLPVTLNAPASGGPCRNVIVDNMGLALRPALPTDAALRLLKEHGVGVVLVGMGNIDATTPDGKLHLRMKQQLLATKDTRYTAGWIWGMSDMRALTAALTEREIFRPTKVLATGGSKRGIAAIASGIHDDRFTAIVPVVASPYGSPSGPFVLGTGSPEVARVNEDFLARLASGKIPTLPETAHGALAERRQRQADVRITVDQARGAGWSEAEIGELNERAWDIIRITSHLPALRKRGFEMLYTVGTNDNANPYLVELGRRFPEFPIHIVPGGQHGGPKTTGFTKQVPTMPEVHANLYAFAQHHFFGARPLVAAPLIRPRWDAATRRLHVTVTMPDGTEPQKNELWWSVNRQPPASLPFEYDAWDSIALTKIGAASYVGETALPAGTRTVDFLSTHHHRTGDLELSVSSPLQRLEMPLSAAGR